MQKLRIGLAVLVTVVWLVGYALAYAEGRSSPAELTGLMAIILGWAFAGTVRDTVKKRLNGAEEDGR